MAKINIIVDDNSRGLSCDIVILRKALEQCGHEVSVTNHKPWGFGERLLRFIRHGVLLWSHYKGRYAPRFDVNIMLEHVSPSYFGHARKNVLVPNPEWLLRKDMRWLKGFDRIFTKTGEATRILRDLLGPEKIQFVGFASLDRWQSDVEKVPRFLHLAGASPMKGTDRLIDLWRQHPEWPELVLIRAGERSQKQDRGDEPHNLLRMDFIADMEQISRLQNACAYHLCLSETEGWGHYLVEGMGCGALILTCDAPPMNELITNERGMLVAADAAGRLNQAVRYQFDEVALESAISRLLALSPEGRRRLGNSARRWFLKNNEEFPARLGEALEQLLTMPE